GGGGPGCSSEGLHRYCCNRQRWASFEFASGQDNRFHGFAEPGRYGQPRNRVDSILDWMPDSSTCIRTQCPARFSEPVSGTKGRINLEMEYKRSDRVADLL